MLYSFSQSNVSKICLYSYPINSDTEDETFKIRLRREAPPNEKPAIVKTHMRNMIVLPEMIGSVVGVHSGKTFNQVEIKVRFLHRRYFLKFVALA